LTLGSLGNRGHEGPVDAFEDEPVVADEVEPLLQQADGDGISCRAGLSDDGQASAIAAT
jgi:hypothetical protein